MTMLGMVYTTYMCVDRMQSSTLSQPSDVDLWQVVDMVEFLMLAAPSSRARVKHQLMAWLLDDAQNSPGWKSCDDTFHKHIIEDVESAWLSNQPYPEDQALRYNRDYPQVEGPTQDDLTYDLMGTPTSREQWLYRS